MTSRRLRSFALAAGLPILMAAPPRVPRPARAAPTPPRVEFDSLVVSPTVFSPNADNVLDRVTITYRLRDTTTVDAFVTPVGSTQVVRTLKTQAIQEPKPQSMTWDGSSDLPGVSVVPDGEYEIHFEGRERTSGSLLVNQRLVGVDTRAAVAVIDSILPPVYTPAVTGTPSPPRVGVQVTDSEPGDSLQVRLRVAATPPRTYRLRLQQNRQDLQGDGFYWTVCDSCGSNHAVPDGVHTLTAATSDAAGNASTSGTSQIDKDVLGPRPAIRHPLPGTVAHVQEADSLVGTAYDRHGVREIRVFVGTDTIPIIPPGRVPLGDSVYVFDADVSTRLAGEGRYPIRLQGEDLYGVIDESRYTMVVDRTPPAKPRLDPRPGPVSKTERLDVRLRIDPADLAYQVIRTGGALAPDTTRAPTSGIADLQVLLRPGANPLTFAVRDSALNVSPPETLTVVWETSRGLAVPERFHPGNTIQLFMGAVEGEGVEVLIYATDGSLVHRFEDSSRKLTYTFTWNLENPQGVRIKNGAYLLLARVRNPDGSVDRWRQLIAVLE